TGHGFKMDRYAWSDEEMEAKITAMLSDKKIKARLKKTSKSMRSKHGPTKAAKVIDRLTRRRLA
ncbi:MAG: glycosyl transferase family 1, partial [Alphaproteobacteria bacterium]|nr:glycosyl transferase family 1 [Alphaproteobacteria bacterium]